MKVTDSDDQTDTLDVTVTVTNVEEDGTVTLVVGAATGRGSDNSDPYRS